MKKNITASLLLLAPALLLAAAPAKMHPSDEVRAFDKQLAAENKPFRERAAAMQKLLAEPRIATNYMASVEGRKKLVNYCRTTYYHDSWFHDRELIKEVFPKLMPEVLDGPYRAEDKLWFIDHFIKYYAVTERYAEGIAMCWDQIAKLRGKFYHEKDTARLYLALAEMCRLADHCELALIAAKDAMKYDSDAGAREGARIAGDWQNEELRREFILKMSVPLAAQYVAPMEQNRWQREVPDWIYKYLSDFVLDETNPAVDRLNVFGRAFARDLTPTGERMLAAMLALPEKEIERANYRADVAVGMSFQCGSWARSARLYELSLRSKSRAGGLRTPKWRRVYLTALFAAGRTADAIRTAGEYAAAEKVTPLDKAVYTAFAALFAEQPIEPALAGLAPKDRAEAIKLVARCAMTVSKTDVAERLAKVYEGCFKPRETRKMNVVFSDEPIRSISDWRRIYAKLPKGPCDIPFGEEMDLSGLISDVTTKREVNLDASGKKVTIQMEATAVADRYALHLFLRVPDPQARDVEHGFVNGITTEMYFAPGLEEPYICFGSNPLQGVTFVMNTLYDSLAHRRLKLAKNGGNLQSEVAFTDTDYVLHVTFPWVDFYQKLPAKAGAEWKFDCIAWAPTGPMTWGGSRGIHHSSDWGHLVFNLKPAELTAIKREIILANYRTWSTPKSTGSYRTLDWCEKWSENRVGDKPFYDKCLKDYGAQLKELQKKVSPKMDDATVNEVYDKGLVHWLGIRHEIDRKRKEYLTDKLLGL